MTPIARQIRELQSKNTSELKEIWRDYFNAPPPPYRSVFLRRNLAYRIQELTYGGLSPKAERKLNSLIAKDKGKATSRRKKSVAIPVAGTRLIREWHGQRYEVIILPNGFEYDGRQWNSLTAVARNITGTNWNGLAFFGLRKKKKG